jgi:uncharacterized protein YlxW (UPF0749 family)
MRRQLQRCNPARRSLQIEDPVPAHQMGGFDDDQDNNNSAGEKELLESILSSQKEMQKKMDQLLHRVDALEDTVKDSSISSYDDDEKKTTRLSTELCVSKLNFLCTVDQ